MKNYSVTLAFRNYDRTNAMYKKTRIFPIMHVLNQFLSYCYLQGVSERKLDPEELFVPSTWDLTE